MKMPTANRVSPPKGAFSHIARLLVYIQAALYFLKVNPPLLAWQSVRSSRNTSGDVCTSHIYVVHTGRAKGLLGWAEHIKYCDQFRTASFPSLKP